MWWILIYSILEAAYCTSRNSAQCAFLKHVTSLLSVMHGVDNVKCGGICLPEEVWAFQEGLLTVWLVGWLVTAPVCNGQRCKFLWLPERLKDCHGFELGPSVCWPRLWGCWFTSDLYLTFPHYVNACTRAMCHGTPRQARRWDLIGTWIKSVLWRVIQIAH